MGFSRLSEHATGREWLTTVQTGYVDKQLREMHELL